MCMIGKPVRVVNIKVPRLAIRVFDGTREHPRAWANSFGYKRRGWNTLRDWERAPTRHSDNGFWVSKDSTHLPFGCMDMVGVVEIRGQCIEHEHGYRAPELRILRLFTVPHSDSGDYYVKTPFAHAVAAMKTLRAARRAK